MKKKIGSSKFLKKMQPGGTSDDFFKKLNKNKKSSSDVMSPDEVKKRTVSTKSKVQVPGVITGFKTSTTDSVKIPPYKKGGQIKKSKKK